jgi:glycosyltransferase involved in cell wall biosynthesis
VRILIIPANDWIYGPKQYFHDLAENLAKEHEVYVWHFDLFRFEKPCHQKVDKVKLIHPFAVQSNNVSIYYALNFLPHSIAFARLVRKLKINAVIVLNLVPALWAFSLAPHETLKVYGLEDYYPESASVYYNGSSKTVQRLLETVALVVNKVGVRLANLTLSPCLSLVNLAKNMGCNKNYFLPNGVDTRLYSPSPQDIKLKKQLGLSNHTIVFFGLLENWLDFDTVLDGLQNLKQEIPDVKLLVIGSTLTGYSETLKKKLDERNLTEDVILTGYVPNELVPKYIDLGNLCLMPYKLDTFSGQIRLPLKLFIYSAMGKPILSVSLPEVKRFKPKHVFFYNDKNSFAASAKSVLNDNKLQDSLKSNARNFALNFDYSKLANSCEEIIESEIKAHIPGNAHSQ